MKDNNENSNSYGSVLNQDEAIMNDCEDELFELDEEMLQILAEPTEAEEQYQKMVSRGEVEQVDWNKPVSVLRYCQTMYQITLKIYGGDCPLQPPPPKYSARKLTNRRTVLH